MLEPQKHTFDTLWGHEAVGRVVPRLLSAGRLPHAILLTGVDAIGKRSMAFAMAKAILSAGKPPANVKLDAPGPAPAKRKIEEEEQDLFGEPEEPDLFGGMEEEPSVPEPAAPEPPAPTPIPKAGPTKPAAPSSPPISDTPRTLSRATFQGFDPRVCRLVESAYPIDYDKNLRPQNSGHVDLTIIEPVGGRRGVLVDQARGLQQIASIAPVEGAYRVVLIFGADTITAEGGNSLLKLLEEPPRYLVLILVADQENRVLPTIRSRCSVIPMSPLSRDVLTRKLIEDEKLDPELAKVAAALSEGRPGVALTAIQAALLEKRRDVFEARLQIDRYGFAALAHAADRIGTGGKLDDALWLLLSFARDRLVAKCAPDNPELLVHGDATDLITGADVSPATIDAEADRLLESYRLLSHPFLPNTRAALELALWPD